MTPLSEFLEDIFHSCALQAYVDVASETKTEKPDSNIVRSRAYQYYEQHKREVTTQQSGAV